VSCCRVAIIADDLTGALDAAAPFAACGAATRVVISLEQLDTALAAWAGDLPEVIAVNTESRHLPPEAAAARVAQAARALAPLVPEWWFKKIDSTLRGQVVAEALALRRATGRRLLLSPAVPAQERIVRGAEVLVNGAPLAATAYGQDARSAPPTGPLDRLFADHGVPLVRYRPLPEADLPGADCVCDAADSADMARIHDAMAEAATDWLPVGAAGLAGAMAQRLFGDGKPREPSLAGVTRRLYAVGSRSPRAGEQLERLRQAWPDLPVIEALRPDTAVPALEEGGLIVAPGVGQASAEAVATAMGERVANLVTAWPAGAGLLLLTGGDTAMAVLQRLDVASIEVVAEWAPGVPLGFLDGDPARPVITKAGGFGEPDLLAALECLLEPAGGDARCCDQS
jgi:D-threonate/D-erythronate kinase